MLLARPSAKPVRAMLPRRRSKPHTLRSVAAFGKGAAGSLEFAKAMTTDLEGTREPAVVFRGFRAMSDSESGHLATSIQNAFRALGLDAKFEILRKWLRTNSGINIDDPNLEAVVEVVRSLTKAGQRWKASANKQGPTGKRLYFELIGGCLDGQTVDGPLAYIYYANSGNGSIGSRFWTASELAQEGGFGVPSGKKFHKHIYEISERLDEETEILVRAKFIETIETIETE
jgi:hypothetical protein